MLRLILAASETEPATAVSMAAVTFSEPACMSAARTLAVSACFFPNFQVLEPGERLGDGRESFLDGVQHGIGFGGHGGLSILRFELWAHPVRFGPGRDRCAIVNCAPQHQCCIAISRVRD